MSWFRWDGEDLILACLDKEKDRRPEGARALRDALARLREEYRKLLVREGMLGFDLIVRLPQVNRDGPRLA